MNFLSRFIWFLLNLFFGATLACTLFYWAACDMQIPVIITDFLSTNLPVLYPIFNIPYVQINKLSSSVLLKLIFNGFLYGLFAFVHTFFAQEYVQSILRRFLFPQQTLRTVYCLLVSLTSFILMGFWQHTHIQLWNLLPSTISTYNQHIILLICYSIIYLPAWYVIIKFRPLEFIGLKQIFDLCPYSRSEQRTTGNQILVTSGLFRLSRHPLYLITMLAWLITPVMSLDRLVFIIYSCIYALIGIPYEERKLIDIFGQDYINYQKSVPALIPYFSVKRKEN